MCLLNASKPVNLGRVSEGPQWKDGVAVLTYVDGDLCPDRIRRKSTTIRLTCSENQVVSDTAPRPRCCALGTGGIEGSVSHRLTSLGLAAAGLRVTGCVTGEDSVALAPWTWGTCLLWLRTRPAWQF